MASTGAAADPAGSTGPHTATSSQVTKGLSFLIRSTSSRPLTVAEARIKLAARDLDDGVIDEVIDIATQQKILDDEAFASAWVFDRGVTRGYGRRRLERELSRRKVGQAAMDSALLALDDVDPVAQATELARPRAQRMPPDLPPQRVAQRLVGFLVRRGFDGDVASRVARQVTALDREWD